MASVIVKKKSIIIWNILAFHVLTLILTYVINALSYSYSSLRQDNLVKWFSGFWPYVVCFLVAILAVYKVKRASKYLMLFFLSSTTFIALQDLYLGHSKGAVILFTIFLPLSFIFYQLLIRELGESYVDPSYHSKELFEPMLKKIECSLIVNDQKYHGWLTNWSNEGCFVRLSERAELPFTEAKIELELLNNTFSFVCLISSKNLTRGYGVRVKNREGEKKNWTFFISKLEDYGYLSERLR